MLYACCLPVRGARRSVICDLQRARVLPVPNSLYELFDRRGCISLTLLRRNIDDAGTRQVLDEYIAFLLREDLAFLCTEADAPHFPRLSQEWHYPAMISNCIIDARDSVAHINANLLDQLAALGCNHIQFRFFEPVDPLWLEELLFLVGQGQVKSVSLLLKALPDGRFSAWVPQVMEKHIKIQTMILHGCSAEVAAACTRQQQGRRVTATTTVLSALHCGVISTAYFSPNIPTFTEALHFNSCLNRKLGIDAAGYIRSCPSMPETFGHISDTPLAEVVDEPAFQRYWTVTKDEVAVCRDCEFRYICTDCRAYVGEPGNDRSKPLKCGYDPYTATWEDWSSSPLRQAAIQYYGL